jgi:magnesium transporter
MSVVDGWVDLLDPTEEEVAAHVPASIHDRAMDQLVAPSTHDDEPRAKFEGHGDYIFGVVIVAVAVPAEDLIFYQEIDLIMTREKLITIRKTPPDGRAPYDPAPAQRACRGQDPVGMVVYHLLDDIAEQYLDLVDQLNEEIDEVEDGIEEWDSDQIRRRISELRHAMLEIRRKLAPLRDAIHQIVDNRIELAGEELFPHEIELNFASAYDKLLRATDGLELARDLVAGARDYHQAKIANDQNDVMKRLTVIASVLLVPTFIVGLYGQNFVDVPELHWRWGYGYVWGLIIVSTIGQLIFYKKRKWL